jgi:hypothetical protein
MGVDGVQIMNALLPETYDEFFEHVVPVLQDKGIMHFGSVRHLPAGRCRALGCQRPFVG